MDIIKKVVSEAIASKMKPYIDEINNGGDISWLHEYDFTDEEIRHAKSKIKRQPTTENSFTRGS